MFSAVKIPGLEKCKDCDDPLPISSFDLVEARKVPKMFNKHMQSQSLAKTSETFMFRSEIIVQNNFKQKISVAMDPFYADKPNIAI